MIEPINEKNLGAALDLLAVGFSTRPRSYWEHAAHRISQFGGNAALDLPIGLLMRDGDRPTGVAFTIASQRPHGERTLSYVNFAAWYVEEDQRWRAPLMLRALTRLKCDVITDLTPSKAVRSLLPTFGFKPLTTGYALNVTAFHGGDGVVEALNQGADADSPLKEALLGHGAFGAIPAVLHTSDGAVTPLLFKPGRFRGLKIAHLVYCGSNARLRTSLGAVARFLRRRGIMLIKLDVAVGQPPPPGWVRMGRELRFARGQAPEDVTDYMGTELSLL